MENQPTPAPKVKKPRSKARKRSTKAHGGLEEIIRAVHTVADAGLTVFKAVSPIIRKLKK